MLQSVRKPHVPYPRCSEAQYDKLEGKIGKMTRVVARELARQGRVKAPEDLHALLREPPEFLHNARIKYTYHRSTVDDFRARVLNLLPRVCDKTELSTTSPIQDMNKLC